MDRPVERHGAAFDTQPNWLSHPSRSMSQPSPWALERSARQLASQPVVS